MNATTAAAAAVAAIWAILVARSPPWFFAAAAPLCAFWIALSLRAAPPGLRDRLRARPADLALGAALALALYAGSAATLRAGCGGLSDALCGPMADLYRRFQTRTLPAALVLGLLVAPAEELFWRGVVQARLVAAFGRARGVAFATALAVAVALASGEPLLALATAPTYAAWGVLAAWRGSLAAAVLSHGLWSVLVASVAPL